MVDGRLPHYSHGLLLSEFAKLFEKEGCVMAYNLDGGASATMVFMGEYINKRGKPLSLRAGSAPVGLFRTGAGCEMIHTSWRNVRRIG